MNIILRGSRKKGSIQKQKQNKQILIHSGVCEIKKKIKKKEFKIRFINFSIIKKK